MITCSCYRIPDKLNSFSRNSEESYKSFVTHWNINRRSWSWHCYRVTIWKFVWIRMLIICCRLSSLNWEYCDVWTNKQSCSSLLFIPFKWAIICCHSSPFTFLKHLNQEQLQFCPVLWFESLFWFSSVFYLLLVFSRFQRNFWIFIFVLHFDILTAKALM